jgi:hypothetical protein
VECIVSPPFSFTFAFDRQAEPGGSQVVSWRHCGQIQRPFREEARLPDIGARELPRGPLLPRMFDCLIAQTEVIRGKKEA